MTMSALNLIPVELTCAGQSSLRARGLLTAFSDRIVTLRLEGQIEPLQADTGVVLCLEDRPAMEIVGLVESHEDLELTVRITRVTHHEKRYFPREYGGIELRWRRLEAAARADAPAEALLTDDQGEWHQPHPFMNFSASGLRFRDTAPCEEGDTLQLLFRVEDQSVWHQATATVVRRAPAPDGTDAEIAVAFDEIAPASIQALADYTLDRQLDELASHGVLH